MDDAIRLENEKVESAQMSLELFCKFLQPFRDGNYLNLPVNVRYECQKWHLELTEHQTTLHSLQNVCLDAIACNISIQTELDWMIETCPTISKNEWQRASPPDNLKFTQSQSPTGESVDNKEAPKKKVKKPHAPKRPERAAQHATESAKKSLDYRQLFGEK